MESDSFRVHSSAVISSLSPSHFYYNFINKYAGFINRSAVVVRSCQVQEKVRFFASSLLLFFISFCILISPCCYVFNVFISGSDFTPKADPQASIVVTPLPCMPNSYHPPILLILISRYNKTKQNKRQEKKEQEIEREKLVTLYYSLL